MRMGCSVWVLLSLGMLWFAVPGLLLSWWLLYVWLLVFRIKSVLVQVVVVVVVVPTIAVPVYYYYYCKH